MNSTRMNKKKYAPTLWGISYTAIFATGSNEVLFPYSISADAYHIVIMWCMNGKHSIKNYIFFRQVFVFPQMEHQHQSSQYGRKQRHRVGYI